MKQSFTLKNLLLIAVSLGFGQTYGQVTTFSFTGGVQTYTVPVGVTSIQIETWGAQGGTGTYGGITPNPGLGGYASGTLSVMPGTTYNIYVGGEGASSGPGGFNGGGQAGTDYGASGGGASDVRISPFGLVDRIIVGAGGGGAAFGSTPSDGGHGGALIGIAGQNGDSFVGGGGGTQDAGGAAGCCYGAATAGTFGLGGGPGDYHNAGGGGGWFGGGSGAGQAGAGGGSSYVDGVIDGVTTAGVRIGNGQVIITVLCSPLTVSVSSEEVCFGDTFTLDASGTGSISWDGGVTNGLPFTATTPGFTTYTATSDDPTDCEFSVDVFVFDEIIIAYSTEDEIAGIDGSIDVTVTGGTAPYTFDWDTDGTGDFDDTEDLSGLVGGTYLISVKDANGCTNQETVLVSSQLNINDNTTASLAVYPNPTTNFVTITYPGYYTYELISVDGKVIVAGSATNSNVVSFESFVTGTYLIRIANTTTQELVKVVKN